MKFKYSILLFFCVLILSCEGKVKRYKGLKYQDYKKNDFNHLQLTEKGYSSILIPNISEYSIPIKMAKLLDTCFIVPLESNAKNLIGRIDEIKVVDNFIFILDSRKSKGVFMFDLNGKYLRKIGEAGNGPDEYPFPGDIAIDENNKEILVFNGNSRKIYKYNFDGDFLSVIPIKFGGYSINVTGNSDVMVFCQGYTNEHLGEIKNKAFYIINNKGEIISYGPSLSKDFRKVKMTISNKISVKNNDLTSYSNKFSDTIYEIKEGKVNTKYFLDFGKNSLNREKLKNLKTNDFLEQIRDKDLTPNFRGNHCQTNSYLYFNFYYGKTIINCYYNKETTELFASNIIDFQNVDCLYSFVAKASHKDYFISTLDAFNLVESKDNISEISDPEWIRNSKKTIEILNDLNIKETDNPVLVFYRLH